MVAGTQAGDYQEATGIYSTFFGASPKTSTDDVLHVGSIKTVIGRKYCLFLSPTRA